MLAAAREEFQKNGFAGGRVDAIADSAGVNKRLIYVYFGSKAELFERVIADNVAKVAASIPFTPANLPEYAVQLFDFWMTDTTSLRLFSWRNVEMSSTPQFENSTYRDMIDQISSAQADETAGLPPAHVLAFAFALVLAWAIPAEAFRATDPTELAARRASIRAAMSRILQSSHLES